jgi:SPFH domain / Band 7 family
MSVKNIAASIVLGLLFVSLVVIYLVTQPNNNSLVTFLSVIIMAVSLIVVLNGDWREIGVMGVFAALVSVVAARFVGQARFGNIGSVVIPILWLGVLVLVFRWISRNRLVVQGDRAIIMQNMYTGALHIVPPPLSPPPLPQMQRIAAIIPKYELSQDVRVEKINTQSGQDINVVVVHVYYRVSDPLAVMSFREASGIPNRGRVQKTIAKEMDQELEVARRDVSFWERMLNQQIAVAIDDIVRNVIWIWDSAEVSKIADVPAATGATIEQATNGAAVAQPSADKPPPNAVDAYKQREQLSSEIRARLNEQVANWGVKILKLELERVEIDPERFKVLGRKKALERETEEEQIKATREATRIRLVREAEAQAEAQRVTELVKSLHDAGVDLPDEKLKEIVIDAILSAEEWERGERY